MHDWLKALTVILLLAVVVIVGMAAAEYPTDFWDVTTTRIGK